MLKLGTTGKTRVIAVALAALPLAAIAWGGNWGTGSGDEGKGQNCRHGSEGMRHMRGERQDGQHIDGRIAFVKAELKITEAQEAQWQAVEDALRAGMAQRGERMAERGRMRGEDESTPAPDRLAAHIEQMESHLEHMKEMQAAVADLYAALTPEQQQAADNLLPGSGPRGPRMK